MFVRRVWFTNDDRRELKETIELLKFLNLRITFGVSEKRLRGNLSNRSSDIRDLLIAGFIKRVSFVNNGWREQKETPSSN
ncbi:hypothetical protein T01_14798 [Trichinella spiralis]|uniref:Uncharacterized protein n=1 Tax=Trichinella spiralis TaxID=6334 RepID=A0A0V1ALK8_TRISP|nr:hypothetical protein T01_14798 [Trichinella spiralis]